MTVFESNTTEGRSEPSACPPNPDVCWGHRTWREVLRGLETGVVKDGIQVAADKASPAHDRLGVAILPMGAVEAHGPHLPLLTDGIIAAAMSESAAVVLREKGMMAWVLPPLHYAPAPFAEGFPGTVTIRRETQAMIVADVVESLERQGIGVVVVANAHFDPEHIGALRDGIALFAKRCPNSSVRVVFPDVTRKPWALRLTDEFKSGACHAGQYETSVVMAREPNEVRHDERKELPAVPASLSQAIASGTPTFEAAGMVDAYCGDPAEATVLEGVETIRVLGRILVDAILEEEPS